MKRSTKKTSPTVHWERLFRSIKFWLYLAFVLALIVAFFDAVTTVDSVTMSQLPEFFSGVLFMAAMGLAFHAYGLLSLISPGYQEFFIFPSLLLWIGFIVFLKNLKKMPKVWLFRLSLFFLLLILLTALGCYQKGFIQS